MENTKAMYVQGCNPFNYNWEVHNQKLQFSNDGRLCKITVAKSRHFLQRPSSKQTSLVSTANIHLIKARLLSAFLGIPLAPVDFFVLFKHYGSWNCRNALIMHLILRLPWNKHCTFCKLTHIFVATPSEASLPA